LKGAAEVANNEKFVYKILKEEGNGGKQKIA